ncbi:hypothetical protein OMR07_02840 [Methylobacterium organophilum]|nr:hypothetical protein [Methylobacterium organophilum]
MILTSRRAFPNTPHNFMAEEAGQHVDRIKRTDVGPQNSTWNWSCASCQHA